MASDIRMKQEYNSLARLMIVPCVLGRKQGLNSSVFGSRVNSSRKNLQIL